jgi:hypothetical protein
MSLGFIRVLLYHLCHPVQEVAELEARLQELETSEF